MKFSKMKLNQVAKEYQLSDFDIAVRFEKGLPKKEKRGRVYGNLFSV